MKLQGSLGEKYFGWQDAVCKNCVPVYMAMKGIYRFLCSYSLHSILKPYSSELLNIEEYGFIFFNNELLTMQSL